ncbi:unnamed protein product [Candidula unifasciata]|uniref:Uncharacterized protein n=1 Tax=Candidula unifasciata TaxID=100452 RepID=A0A8S3YJB9_9EUPU|nr:unnamed protein product [Candidula unifasciata]
MRGRKNPMNNQTPPNLPPCKICGEQGTGFHYGVTACGACKGFFRRSLVRKQPYVCNANGQCTIGPETKRRKSCPKCRHDKCLAVGMSKEAIKTGRYSYVKKSHDIIEMIEHHFHHFVKRKQFGDYKMSRESIEDDLDISAKKSRSSCALEKISEAFRKPGHEFMELSPTKSSLSSENAFTFDDSNITDETVFPVTEINNLINLEKEKIGVLKDNSTRSDAMGSQRNTIHTLPEGNGIYAGWCSGIKNSEFAHYFNSSTTKSCQASPTSPPVSSSSPMSDMSSSRESSMSVSTSWLEFPNYADSLYTVTSPDDSGSFLAYPDNVYDADFESYPQQQRWHENIYFNDDEYAKSKDERVIIKESLFSNQASNTVPSYTAEQDTLYGCSINIQEYNSYNKNIVPAHNTQFLHLHTPVSNELEQLRRLSWDDMSFGDDFLCPGSDFVTDKSRTPQKNKSSNNKDVTACFPPNNNIIRLEKAWNAGPLLPEFSNNSYWDLDETRLKSKDVSFNNSIDHKKEHFQFESDINQSCTSYSSPTFSGSYYRERQGSDSSIESYSLDTRFSPAVPSDQQTLSDCKSSLSECEEALTVGGTSPERHFVEDSQNSYGLSGLLINSSLPLGSPSSLFSTSDDLDMSSIKKGPAIISQLSDTMALEESEEPLNFLNIPYENTTQFKKTGKLISYVALQSQEMSANSEDDSPKNTKHLPTLSSEVSNDDEHLEKWTPFSLGGETPRPIEQEGKPESKIRLHENEEDYNSKPLPWCEFTEAELDEVVMSLKTAYQKHVVIDSHLLSDEEIAEKLKSFLDILELREQTYGKLIGMDREAYFNILEATGIDVGGRRDWTETHAKILNRTLQKTVRFFRSVPGFKDVCHEDKIVLAKSCLYEYVILSCYRGVNLEKQVILDAEHKYAISMDVMKLMIPEMEDHMLDMLAISRRLMELKLSFEETLLLKAISITSPDRDKIQDFEKVDRMYWRLHCCLILSLWRLVTVLTDLRGLAFYGRQIMSNLKPDIMKLTKDIQVPLYLEMLFSETDSSTSTNSTSSRHGQASALTDTGRSAH